MAKEFLILTTIPSSRVDETVYQYLSFYPVSPVIEVNGQTVIETPSTTLPPIVDLYGLMTAGEKNALDNGTFVYYTDTITRYKNEIIPQVIARMKTKWTNTEAVLVDDLRAKYQFTDTWVDI